MTRGFTDVTLPRSAHHEGHNAQAKESSATGTIERGDRRALLASRIADRERCLHERGVGQRLREVAKAFVRRGIHFFGIQTQRCRECDEFGEDVFGVVDPSLPVAAMSTTPCAQA